MPFEPFAALERKHVHFYAPRYQVLVDGVDLLRAGVEVENVSVNEVIDGASRVTYTVLNRDLEWLDSPLFEPGARVVVRMGYTNALEVLFVGEITELKPTFPANGVALLEVGGHDLSHRMSRGCHFRSWQDMKDSDVAAQIAQEYGLRPEVQDTEEKRRKIKQNGESDLEFLAKRAEKQKRKYEVIVREETLYFNEKQEEETAEVVTNLKWGESLISFAPELNTAGVVSEVTVRGWDPMNKQEIIGQAGWREIWGRQGKRISGGQLMERLYSQGGKKPDECVRTEPVYTQQEAKDRALAVLKEKADTFITGSAESIGLPEIRVRSAIILEGLGRFDMQYYITGTTHSISGTGGYKTSFTVKSNTYNRAENRDA
jgi:Bacteriophage probable baseplate hub protein